MLAREWACKFWADPPTVRTRDGQHDAVNVCWRNGGIRPRRARVAEVTREQPPEPTEADALYEPVRHATRPVLKTPVFLGARADDIVGLAVDLNANALQAPLTIHDVLEDG